LRKTAAGGGGVDGAAEGAQGEKLEHHRLNEPSCTFSMTGVLCLLAYQETALTLRCDIPVVLAKLQN